MTTVEFGIPLYLYKLCQTDKIQLGGYGKCHFGILPRTNEIFSGKEVQKGIDLIKRHSDWIFGLMLNGASDIAATGLVRINTRREKVGMPIPRDGADRTVNGRI